MNFTTESHVNPCSNIITLPKAAQFLILLPKFTSTTIRSNYELVIMKYEIYSLVIFGDNFPWRPVVMQK